jgi:hypothetical protein
VFAGAFSDASGAGVQPFFLALNLSAFQSSTAFQFGADGRATLLFTAKPLLTALQ